MNKIKDFLGKTFSGRSFRYGSVTLLIIAVVIAITVLINMSVGMLDIKFDLTPNKAFSIGDTTKTVLKELGKDVEIVGLFDDATIGANNDYKEVVEILEKYAKESKHIKVRYSDPDKNPGLIGSLDKNGNLNLAQFDLVFKCGNKVKKVVYGELGEYQQTENPYEDPQKIGSKAEQAITGAIKYVTADKTPVIYFTQGHGEEKVDEKYNIIKEYLQNNNYEVKTLESLAKIPEDTSIIITASPKSDLTVGENQSLKNYLSKGGEAIFLFGYQEVNTIFTQFEDVLKAYNISLNYDAVRETDDERSIPQDSYSIYVDIQSNDIIPDDFTSVNPYALISKSRSINTLRNELEYVKVTPLIRTSSTAVGDKIDNTGENKGPLDIALASERSDSKIIVMGNAYFMTDEAMQTYGAQAANMIVTAMNNWMGGKMETVDIGAKVFDNETLVIDAFQANVISIVVVFVFPLIILGIGTYVWLKRRHL